MRRRLDYAVAVTVRKDDYRACASAKVRSECGGIYGFAVLRALHHVHEWAWDRTSVPRFAYFIESGAAGHQQVDNLFAELMRRPWLRHKFRVASYTWVGKEEPTVHPSDLASHEVATCYEKPPTPLLETLTKCVTVRHVTRDHITQANEGVNRGISKRRHLRSGQAVNLMGDLWVKLKRKPQ
jgi:hypothetical protein